MEAANIETFVNSFRDEAGRIFRFVYISRPHTKRLVVHFTAFFGEWGERKEYRENYQGYFHRLRMLRDVDDFSALFVCDQDGV